MARKPKKTIPSKKITTLEMEIILMEYFKFNQKIVVPNVRYGITYKNRPLNECDLLVLTGSNYGVQIEIKISKADLMKDKDKKHNHNIDHPLIKTFYFAVPYYLEEALEVVPDYAGLLIVNENGTVYEKRKPINDKKAIKWTDELILKLGRLAVMRIYNLKKNILKLRDK